MSFRLRIFVLVMVVAVTAIGATAWLTLRLTQRELAQAARAAADHQDEIIDAVRDYGFRHGSWPGVDKVVAEESNRTELHIQLRSTEAGGIGDIVADSDNIANQASGPVRGTIVIDPRPTIDPSILQTPSRLSPSAERQWVKKTGLLPADLFGPAPQDGALGGPGALMLRQAAQYRAALLAVRCTGDAGLPTAKPPYLTPAQISGRPACVSQAAAAVRDDRTWLSAAWSQYTTCQTPDATGLPKAGCLEWAFSTAVTDVSAVPLQLFLGSRNGLDLAELGRPAAFGAAGLVVVAVLGTAWIARRFSRPVRRLTMASVLLAGGHFNIRVPVRGRSELDRLTQSFNTMAEAVQRSEERQRRLIADVAHEMRTPLSNLRGYLEGLSDGVVEPSRELFASLHEETLLQGRILDDLQVLAQAEAGDLNYARSATDLADLVSAGATAHRAVAAEAGIALTVDAPHPVWVQADSDRLRQVLGNLLSNAIRYTDEGGHVLLKVRADDGEAVLTVQDTGVGIAPGDLPRVFDRFWRADPARQRATGGTGLGLTIAHRIVTDHGGRIDVTSRPHIGTTFTVHLPRERPPGQ
ncbi:ATP-binding protein [Actinoplanes sp. NPDC051411]|uniref:sensor histidine kinase n=1 Tax=Actinoplanes sp. NPDC051411 TaxID=3155522 RepID=UPI0034213148